MVGTVQISADHERHFSPLADHMIKLWEKIMIFQHFEFHFNLMLEQALSNLIVCLMIS